MNRHESHAVYCCREAARLLTQSTGAMLGADPKRFDSVTLLGHISRQLDEFLEERYTEEEIESAKRNEE